MKMETLFWSIMILAFVFSGWVYWPGPGEKWFGFGSSLVVYVLIFLLGYKVYGPPLKE